ncbi:hypothetical protein [Cupriavidus sp. EM10]|uniref:hypothetical protein n=1 Tax=Cupriavidus sp. EM10 TaxID=2839983 RepID=UPI001CED4155|nr:hypothetical protein [Cupriavidus sp. EM10]
MDQKQPRVSMRHLHLYAHLLLAEAKQNGKSVRLEWANIPPLRLALIRQTREVWYCGSRKWRRSVPKKMRPYCEH